MIESIKIGIIICDRYSDCAGGKCLKSLKERAGAFSIYQDSNVDLVGYTTCGGCPGGNVEYSPEEMKNNGVQVIHLATGLIVGYPPCPFIHQFKELIEEKFGLKVEFGTHPIPEKYYKIHKALNTWNTTEWEKVLSPTITDEKIRLSYD